MVVGGKSVGGKGDIRAAADFAESRSQTRRHPRSGAPVHRPGASKIGQGKGGLAVPAVGCANDRKQSQVLRYRHYLAVAKRVVPGCKVKSEQPDFTDVGLSHEYKALIG